MRRFLLLLTSVGLLTSCADAPTRVDSASPSDEARSPAFEILDGSRGGGAGFYWLPPMVTSLPTTTGTFDNTVLNALDVELCALEANACAPGGLQRRFRSVTGSFFDRIRLVPNRQYQVMYSSAADNLARDDFAVSAPEHMDDLAARHRCADDRRKRGEGGGVFLPCAREHFAGAIEIGVGERGHEEATLLCRNGGGKLEPQRHRELQSKRTRKTHSLTLLATIRTRSHERERVERRQTGASAG